MKKAIGVFAALALFLSTAVPAYAAADNDTITALEAEIEMLREERDSLAQKLEGIVEGTVGNSHVAIGQALQTQDIYGKPCIMVEFTWSHDQEDLTAFAWAVEALAFQNGVECAVAYDVAGLDVSLATRNVKKGAQQSLWRAYYIEDETAPVEIEVREAYAVGDVQKFSRIYQLPLVAVTQDDRGELIGTQIHQWTEDGLHYLAVELENRADYALDTTLEVSIQLPSGETVGRAERSIGTLQLGERKLCVFARNQDLRYNTLNITVDSGKNGVRPAIVHTLVLEGENLFVVLDNQGEQYAEEVTCDILFFQGSDVVHHSRIELDGKLEAGSSTIRQLTCPVPFDSAVAYVGAAVQ